MSSIARFGRLAGPMLVEVTRRVLLGRQSHSRTAVTAASVGTVSVASKPAGLNRERMVTTPKACDPHEAVSSGIGVCAEPLEGVGEGRSHVGRNGRLHHVGHRGIGPGMLGEIRRDNVGKVRLPAGTDNNLQRPARRGRTEAGGRDSDWRMSSYELRRRGNPHRGSAGRIRGEGNAGPAQRSSGHLAVPGRSRTMLSRELLEPRSRDYREGKPTRGGAYAGQRLSLPGFGKALMEIEPRSEPDSGNPTVRDRRGARGNVTHGRTRNPLSRPKGLYWKLSAYRCARPGSIPTPCSGRSPRGR